MTALSYTFPNDFIWGAATAAHQIEGNNVSSDWWAREHSPNTDLSEASNDACDSYNRFEEDIRLLAASGLRMYRFSIEWARIEPECGCFSKAQLLHYRRMIDTCRQYGVEPMVTLYHMTLPLWFAEQGGWRRADAMADGIDVRGYLHWSLLDNYEWGSFRPTFGLIGWDRDTFERHPRPSLDWLGNVSRSGVLSHPSR